MAKTAVLKPFLAVAKDKFTINTIEDMIGRRDLALDDVVELNGYYTAGDGAGHKRKIEATDDGSGVQLANGLWANIVHNGEVNVSWFGAKGDGVTDDTIFIQRTINYSTDRFLNVNFATKKQYVINEGMSIRGGFVKTIDFRDSIIFAKGHPTSVLTLESISTNTSIKNLTIQPFGNDSIRKRVAVTISGSNTCGVSNWKNNFHNIRIYRMKHGVEIISENSNDGSKQDFASENLFSHVRIRHCLVGVVFRNSQAFNNTFLNLDIENTEDEDIENGWTLFQIFSGSGINILGGSFIGKGNIFEYGQKDDSVYVEFQQGIVNINNIRIEKRGSNKSVFLKELKAKETSRFITFNISGVSVSPVGSGEFLAYEGTGGRGSFNFCSFTGREQIFKMEIHPTAGFSGVAGTAYGNIFISEGCDNFIVSVLDYSDYGTFAPYYTPRVRNNSKKNKATKGVDDNGFRETSYTFQNILADGFNEFQTRRVSYSRNQFASGFNSVKLKLNYNNRILKVFGYKNSASLSGSGSVSLFIVKDIEHWANRDSFNKETDAFLYSTFTLAKGMGYFEFNVFSSSKIGADADVVVGTNNWREGRVLIEVSTSVYAGFLGLEII